MKILLNTYSGYGNWFTRRFQQEGHDVDIHCTEAENVDVLQGLVPKPFTKAPNYSKYDLSIFDLTGRPKQAEESYQQTPTIGDGNIHCMLEDDREFGIRLMEECGINVPPYEAFDNINEAKKFIQKTNKRYVFKPDGGQDQDAATTYVSESAEDLLEYLDKISNDTKGVAFILQEVIQGTEISTEAYFNGQDFFFINATLEEKKLMNDGKGPNTGCSGNLVWWYSKEPRVFTEGLGRAKNALSDLGFRGMIDLNSIVTDSRLYGLEWTPRFGYDASATLFQLISSDLGNFLHTMASGENAIYETSPKFGAGVRLSIPPYPTEIKGKHPAEVPVKVNTRDLDTFIDHCYMYDVLRDGDSLVTAGKSGFIAVPLGRGDSINDAFDMVDDKIKMMRIPNAQYRTDIRKKCLDRYTKLESQGWLR